MNHVFEAGDLVTYNSPRDQGLYIGVVLKTMHRALSREEKEYTAPDNLYKRLLYTVMWLHGPSIKRSGIYVGKQYNFMNLLPYTGQNNAT